MQKTWMCYSKKILSTRIIRVNEKQKYITLGKIFFRAIWIAAGIHSSLWRTSKLLPRLGSVETLRKLEFVVYILAWNLNMSYIDPSLKLKYVIYTLP